MSSSGSTPRRCATGCSRPRSTKVTDPASPATRRVGSPSSNGRTPPDAACQRPVRGPRWWPTSPSCCAALAGRSVGRAVVLVLGADGRPRQLGTAVGSEALAGEGDHRVAVLAEVVRRLLDGCGRVEVAALVQARRVRRRGRPGARRRRGGRRSGRRARTTSAGAGGWLSGADPACSGGSGPRTPRHGRGSTATVPGVAANVGAQRGGSSAGPVSAGPGQRPAPFSARGRPPSAASPAASGAGRRGRGRRSTSFWGLRRQRMGGNTGRALTAR